MKKILAALIGGLLIGAIAASHAKLPAPPPKSDAEKAADAEKANAANAKDAADLGKAQDKAVANYKKGKGGESKGAASMDAAPKASTAAGKK
jgi:hypothetical protein